MFRPSRILGTALAVVLAAGMTGRAAEPDKLIPADAEAILFVNVRQFLDSDISKKYFLDQIKTKLQENEAQKAIRELGLDPLKDVDRVVIAASGTDASDAKVLVIVRGKFDPDKLYKAAESASKRDGDKLSKIQDDKGVMFKFQPDNGPAWFTTVIDETAVVVASDKAIVSAAVAASTANKKPALNRELATLVGRMDDKASVWVAALMKDKLNKVPLPQAGPGADLVKQLTNLDHVTLAVRVAADVNLDVGLGLKDEAAADEFLRTLDDGLSQIKGFLAFAAGDPKLKPLAEFVRSIKTGAKGKSVTVSGKLPGEAIGQMLKPAD